MKLSVPNSLKSRSGAVFEKTILSQKYWGPNTNHLSRTNSVTKVFDHSFRFQFKIMKEGITGGL